MGINEARSDARDALRQTKDSAAPPALQIALLRAALDQLLSELDKLCDDEEPSPGCICNDECDYCPVHNNRIIPDHGGIVLGREPTPEELEDFKAKWQAYVVQPGDCYGCHGHGDHDGSWHEAVVA